MTTKNGGGTSIELFAGGGGMALGLRGAGFKHRQLIEMNKNAVAVLRANADEKGKNWTEPAVIHQDVVEWLASNPQPQQVVDLIAGGPPCQPFSLSGAHAGQADGRNMFPAALDVVRRYRPQAVIFENVPGLLRKSFADYFAYIKHQLTRPEIEPISEEFWFEHDKRVQAAPEHTREYHVHQLLLESADFGVAQNRQRVFLVALRADLAGAAEWKGPAGKHSRARLLHDQYVSGAYWERHGLAPEPAPEALAPLIAALQGHPATKGRPWTTLRDELDGYPAPVPAPAPPALPQHVAIAGARAYPGHTGSRYDWPGKTIKAGVHGVAGGESMIRFNDGRLRYLTVREAARVQGFPDTYLLPGARSRVMGVIGNAVAVPVAAALGSAIAASLFPKAG